MQAPELRALLANRPIPHAGLRFQPCQARKPISLVLPPPDARTLPSEIEMRQRIRARARTLEDRSELRQAELDRLLPIAERRTPVRLDRTLGEIYAAREGRTRRVDVPGCHFEHSHPFACL